MPESLAVVIPAYNEAEIIRLVVTSWHQALSALDVEFDIFVYNDGSTDGTSAVLHSINLPHLHIIDKTNSGHGPTILQGYLSALQYTWFFQCDSDNETSPVDFPSLWQLRNEYDFLIGRRNNRRTNCIRKLISAISRLTVRILCGNQIHDVNSPYRLMRSSAIAPIINAIPANTFAPNIIISGQAAKHTLRIKELPISSTQRQTGAVSIKSWKLLKAAIVSFYQTIISLA